MSTAGVLLGFLAVALAVSLAPPSAAKPVPLAPPGVTVEQDLPYLESGREEKLDLYLPAGRAKGVRSPGIVIIHGGGWTGGDKADYRQFNFGSVLAQAGYVCVSVNYMMEEGKRWPTNLLDCKNAVRFLRKNAERYQVDPEHIGVMGGSAGGHLALMVGYTSDIPELEPREPYPGISSRVQAVANFYGITSLLTRQKTDEQGNPSGVRVTSCGLFPRSAGQDRRLWELASPVYHVSKDCPPTLTLHGKSDTTVDWPQALELNTKLAEVGVEHKLLLIQGIGHTFDLDSWGKRPLPYDLRSIVTEFFDKHLKR